MNKPLVKSLVQVILSLSQEERALLEERLHRQTNWCETLKKIDELRSAIHAEREGKPFDPPLEEYIWQTREERTQQQDELIRSCFPPPETK